MLCLLFFIANISRFAGEPQKTQEISDYLCSNTGTDLRTFTGPPICRPITWHNALHVSLSKTVWIESTSQRINENHIHAFHFACRTFVSRNRFMQATLSAPRRPTCRQYRIYSWRVNEQSFNKVNKSLLLGDNSAKRISLGSCKIFTASSRRKSYWT